MNMNPYAWCLLCLSVAADTGRRLGYVMDNSIIYTARDAWLSNPTAAEATYGHISTWDTSGVTDMSYLFCGSSFNDCNTAATSFNEDISAWDTSGVTRMDYMFYYASAFDQDIGAWDTSGVITMDSMFYYASAFDQDLPWCVDDGVYTSSAFYGAVCASTSCGVGILGYTRCPDYDGDGVVDAAPEGECCVSAYGQPFTDACGTTLTEVRTSGCCPNDFLLRYSHDIYEKLMTDYTRWDCVSFVGKDACDLMGPPYTWGSCWASVYDQGMAVCDTSCDGDNGFDVRACGGLFLQEAKGKWGDWWYNAPINPHCREHSCCAQDPDDCCETNPAAVAGAVVIGFAVLAGLISLYYKRCRKPAIAEPSTPPPKEQTEAMPTKEEEAVAVAPEAEESPQETLVEEPPPLPPARSWSWRAETEPEAEEAERPPPPAKSWFGRAGPEPEPEEPPLSPFSALRAERERELKTLASP